MFLLYKHPSNLGVPGALPSFLQPSSPSSLTSILGTGWQNNNKTQKRGKVQLKGKASKSILLEIRGPVKSCHPSEIYRVIYLEVQQIS